MGKLHGVPDLPPHYLPREEVLAGLKQKLLVGCANVGITGQSSAVWPVDNRIPARAVADHPSDQPGPSDTAPTARRRNTVSAVRPRLPLIASAIQASPFPAAYGSNRKRSSPMAARKTILAKSASPARKPSASGSARPIPRRAMAHPGIAAVVNGVTYPLQHG
jgi:hypothetical protein